jgi:hypothetical protein
MTRHGSITADTSHDSLNAPVTLPDLLHLP